MKPFPYATVEEYRKVVNYEKLRFYKAIQDTCLTIGVIELRFKGGEVYLLTPGLAERVPSGVFEEVAGNPALFEKRYDGQDLNGKKLLVTRGGGIGDLMFMQPALRYLKHKYPRVQIYLGTSSVLLSLFENWDCLTEAFATPLSLARLEECDYYANYYGLAEFCEDALRKNSYYLFPEFLGLKDLPDEFRRPKLDPLPKRVARMRAELDRQGIGKRFIYLQLQASCVNRTPGISIFLVLFEKLVKMGYQLVICDHPSRSAHIDDIIGMFRDIVLKRYPEDGKRLIKNLVNMSQASHDLQDMIALISLSSYLIAPDSATIHVAGAQGIPAYGLFTVIPAELRLATYKTVTCNPVVRDESVCRYGGCNCFIPGDEVCEYLLNETPKCFFRQIDMTHLLRDIRARLKPGQD